MALPSSLLSIVADQTGHGVPAFLCGNAEAWASKHMLARYRIPVVAEDPPWHFASRCHQKLLEEYAVIRGWFLDDGSFSPVLQERYMNSTSFGQIGDGIGWDFTRGGELDPRMLQFKCSMLAASRTMDGIPPSDISQVGLAPIGVAMRLAASAFTERAAMHRWRPIEEEVQGKRVVRYSGAEMSRRWVTFRTYSFLVTYGIPHAWAWDATKAKQVFGPTDEERAIY